MTSPTSCNHECAVYSTSLVDETILVNCVKCHLLGSIKEASQEEWENALQVGPYPYLWHDPNRIIPTDQHKQCVLKVDNDHLRIWQEVIDGLDPPLESDREMLTAIIEQIVENDLDSPHFPFLVEQYQMEHGTPMSSGIAELCWRLMANAEQRVVYETESFGVTLLFYLAQSFEKFRQ